jgi:hypothetical protein
MRRYKVNRALIVKGQPLSNVVGHPCVVSFGLRHAFENVDKRSRVHVANRGKHRSSLRLSATRWPARSAFARCATAGQPSSVCDSLARVQAGSPPSLLRSFGVTDFAR